MDLIAPPETCIKRGVILTCYVDGRKRFRAVRLLSATLRRPPATITDSTGHFYPRK